MRLGVTKQNPLEQVMCRDESDTSGVDTVYIVFETLSSHNALKKAQAFG